MTTIVPTPGGNLYIMTEPEHARDAKDRRDLIQHRHQVEAELKETQGINGKLHLELQALRKHNADLRARLAEKPDNSYAEACAPFDRMQVAVPIRTAKEELFAQLYGGTPKADSEETTLWRHAFLEACSDMKDTPGGEPQFSDAAAAADEALLAFRQRFRIQLVKLSKEAMKARVALAVQGSLRGYAVRTWPDPDCCERRATEQILQDYIMADAAGAVLSIHEPASFANWSARFAT